MLSALVLFLPPSWVRGFVDRVWPRASGIVLTRLAGKAVRAWNSRWAERCFGEHAIAVATTAVVARAWRSGTGAHRARGARVRYRRAAAIRRAPAQITCVMGEVAELLCALFGATKIRYAFDIAVMHDS
jgi:hypothetical protein